MKRVLYTAAVLGALLAVTASAARAAGGSVWVGRDLDNNRVFWTCTKAGGNDWTLKKNGRSLGDYEGVTSTSEFVELQLKGTRTFSRVRLYKDKLSVNKGGSKTEWVQMAKGKWDR